ncbi:MAG: DUF222 domain-containing protein [Acidimicrobiales bacterium]
MDVVVAESPGESPGEVPLERLEADLLSFASMIAAATGRWLGWLAEYDRREGWAHWGCKSAAHWLSHACGMSERTGRDHVRVARALEELPVVRQALRCGELSFSKARALTRLVRPIDEQAMVELARTATAAQLDRIVAGHRQIDASLDPHDDTNRRRYRQRALANGMVEVSVVVPADAAALIDKAVAARVEETLADTSDPDRSITDRVAERGGWSTVRADAAVALLGGSVEPQQFTLDIEVAVDPDDGDGDPAESAVLAVSGARLPAEVARRCACDATAQVSVVNNADGEVIGIGRRCRVVPRWLRRRVERRDDHTCQFPSCSSTRRLHTHHIIHWTDEGPTDLDNLVLLCSFHHHLVHEGGWKLTGTATDHTITRPDTTPLTPASLAARRTTGKKLDLSTSPELDPNQLTAKAGSGDTYDHNYIVDVTWHHNQRFRGTAPDD